MPSLKDLRVRIRSVKSTQKITTAMKLVAASRLRRAQDAAEAARPFAERMDRMLSSLASSMAGLPGAPRLLAGTGKADTHLLIVATSDRGLAGGFNGSILREARRQISQIERAGKRIIILTVGRKGRDGLRRDHAGLIRDSITDLGRKGVTFAEAQDLADRLLGMFERGDFDTCSIIFARFRSAITQIVTVQQLIPFNPPEKANPARRQNSRPATPARLRRFTTSSRPRKRSWRSCCRRILPSRSSRRCWRTRPPNRAPA